MILCLFFLLTQLTTHCLATDFRIQFRVSLSSDGLGKLQEPETNGWNSPSPCHFLLPLQPEQAELFLVGAGSPGGARFFHVFATSLSSPSSG